MLPFVFGDIRKTFEWKYVLFVLKEKYAEDHEKASGLF